MTHLFSLSMKLINIIMEEVVTFLWMVTLYSQLFQIFLFYFQRETLSHISINELIESHYNMKMIKEDQQLHQTV